MTVLAILLALAVAGCIALGVMLIDKHIECDDSRDVISAVRGLQCETDRRRIEALIKLSTTEAALTVARNDAAYHERNYKHLHEQNLRLTSAVEFLEQGMPKFREVFWTTVRHPRDNSEMDWDKFEKFLADEKLREDNEEHKHMARKLGL